ncbi:WhiB family transcriptional regulator [Micromonospora sp. NPDC020750]|uniref:WhiB family transcriptional regulator n=1 Tax=unclassified Micromonospora TaxID=2617518 RepID=UPI003794A4C5
MRRPAAAEDDWRGRGACRDRDPERWFPVGTTGPALVQAEQAKAICRRCPVKDECLSWALDNQKFGVAGGMDEDERRTYKHSTATHTMRLAA